MDTPKQPVDGKVLATERISADAIHVRRMRSLKRKYSLAKLCAGITKKNRHAEIFTGKPVGYEVW